MPPVPAFVILSGPSGAGKTTICRRVVDTARRGTLKAGGVLSEVRTAGGIVTGLDALDVTTDARLPLAEVDRPTGGPVTGRWHFHETTFAAGLDWCARLEPETLFVIDELGPLELVQGLGWAPLLPVLAAYGGPALAVVRPALVSAFIQAINGRPATRVEVTRATRDAAAAQVLALLGLAA